MLSRRIMAARPLSRAILPAISRTTLTQRRFASSMDELDPDMNGGYTQSPPVKRQFRDPYGEWWDMQERRNYGEPIHEDNDVLGIFSTWDYTHFTAGWGGVLMGCFVATVVGFAGVVYQYYPDKPSAPRTFPGGLDKELGGDGAPLAPVDE